ncbi:hypothetical protein Patl1_33907 [Pistacia atlantica]|uniref:Uncharacterized protein n=1 Tax=Pistacia atlantica TaxID=434234 RepID=A0ACC0ZSB9_9ROSI|nr:hypothetical protein Patl1_33907 [Pistacia atlantica]
MSINNAKSFLVTLLIFAMVLSPLQLPCEAARVQGLDRVLLQDGPVCPACVCCAPAPPGGCCPCFCPDSPDQP